MIENINVKEENIIKKIMTSLETRMAVYIYIYIYISYIVI